MTKSADSLVVETPPAELKPYSTPALTDFGAVETITKGAIGIGGDLGIYS